MTMTVKELQERLKQMPDDEPVIAVMGKERFEGDVVKVHEGENGYVTLEVAI